MFGINIYGRLFIDHVYVLQPIRISLLLKNGNKIKNIKGDAVDTNRRDALKLGASAAMSGMFISNAIAAPDAQSPIVVEPMSGKAGFRIANYLPRMGATSRLGLVTN